MRSSIDRSSGETLRPSTLLIAISLFYSTGMLWRLAVARIPTFSLFFVSVGLHTITAVWTSARSRVSACLFNTLHHANQVDDAVVH